MIPDTTLVEMRKVAEAATPGRWHRLHDPLSQMAVTDSEATRLTVRQRVHPCECGQVWSEGADWPVAYADTREMGEGPSKPVIMANALHISTFDPPTVIALLDRLALAEARLAEAEKTLELIDQGICQVFDEDLDCYVGEPITDEQIYDLAHSTLASIRAGKEG